MAVSGSTVLSAKSKEIGMIVAPSHAGKITYFECGLMIFAHFISEVSRNIA
jgi:hypothetical protein